jgi:hypothetical protein
VKIKILLAAFAGLVVGALAAWMLAARITGNVFGNQYVTAVMDQANVALHIRAGKQNELLTAIEARLPEYVLEVGRDFRGNPGSTNALWMVKAYYERNKIATPSEIKDILDSLPPKPPTACQIRLRALDGALRTNRTEAGAKQ